MCRHVLQLASLRSQDLTVLTVETCTTDALLTYPAHTCSEVSASQASSPDSSRAVCPSMSKSLYGSQTTQVSS